MSGQASAATVGVGGTTREKLLRAAERLFAERGVGPTTARAIVREAGQRNESALQYHFGGREGLIEAMYTLRGAQVEQEREHMLRELDDSADSQDLRRLCEVAVMPPVRLARRDPDFALFLKVIGQLVFLPGKTLRESTRRYTGAGVAQVSKRIRAQLTVSRALADRRLDLVHRMAALALAQRALSGGSFDGPDAELFFETLLDAMAAILEGPASQATERELSKQQR